MRRIFARVSDDTFYACLERVRRDKLDLGQVLSGLVESYVKGEIVIAPEDVKSEVRR